MKSEDDKNNERQALEFCKQEIVGRNIDDQTEGNPKNKLRVTGFMAKNMHAKINP